MRRNSKTLPIPTSNVIDRSFEQRLSIRQERLSRQEVEREVQKMLETDEREDLLIKLFHNLPLDKQRDVLAIAEVYHEKYGPEH